ncbi:MAG: hypothetical protein HYX27_04590 [Acidobacteria bacterium]|nr:hypothetical protein [Acidobacteriota bacterium]
MAVQNLQNHSQRVPGFLAVGALLLLTFIGGAVNLYKSVGDHQRLYSAALVPVLTACVFFVGMFARRFALRAQDRAIRAEESLRHYILTGKPLDARLEPLQVVALRFAGDDEFPALATRAAEQNLAPADIKKQVKYWRPDTYRV